MASISEQQRDKIIALVKKDEFSGEEIAAQLGVSPGTVSAIKAHITMGTYSSDETDKLIEAAEATFGLERDLQAALLYSAFPK
jgi:DNA-binding CsgD family transcriptional regulator